MTTVFREIHMLESFAKPSISSQRLRILFLAPFAPHLQADHGGGRVIAQLIAHLSERNSIGLCYLRSQTEPAVDPVLRERCAVVEEVVIPDSKVYGLKHWFHRMYVWKQVLAGKPLWAIDRFAAAYEHRVKSLLQSWQPDIVQIEFHVMGQYLPALLGYPSPRILIEHEPGVETAQEFMDSPFARGRVRPLLDLLAWKRFEPSIIRKVDTVVVFTERDRKAIRDLGGKTPIVQIPFGTEISESSPNPQPLDALSLLFVGNFKHPPNLDAADRLINHIFPRVRAQIPEARLFVVGNHLPASLTHKANENLVVTGYVPDLTPYLNRAAVVVLPLRFGGGMRVKMLEALAAGKAIIASKRAVEGLDVMNGKQVILAEEDQEFVDAILDLLRNREKRSALAMNAHTWAVANLGWDKLAAVYEKLYRSLLKC